MNSRWKSLMLATTITLMTVCRAEAHIDFHPVEAIEPCFPAVPGETCFRLRPLLQPEQFMIPVTPILDPFPLPDDCLQCPPFIEILDIPNLDLVNFGPTPSFLPQSRLLGDPSPDPMLVDDPTLPNLLLIYDGANEIAGPAELDPFELTLPPHITRLPFVAQAFNAEGAPVSNVGFIQVAEPSGVVSLILGAAAATLAAGSRRVLLSATSDDSGHLERIPSQNSLRSSLVPRTAEKADTVESVGKTGGENHVLITATQPTNW